MEDNKSSAPWKTTDNRFVAFFDILGFKDKIMRQTHDEIYEDLQIISKTTSLLEKSLENDFTKASGGYLHFVTFSDSIVIFSKDDSIENFSYFTTAAIFIFRELISNKLAVKGAVAHGLTSVNKTQRLFFGQSIIDAYLLEEDMNFFGVLCHCSIDNYILKTKAKIMENKKGRNVDHSVLNFYEIHKSPLKSGKISHLNVAWYSDLVDENEHASAFISKVEGFYSTVSGSPRRYIDNTIEFLECINKSNKQSKSPTY